MAEGKTEVPYIGFGGDPINPDWSREWRVHNWRNYITDDLRAMWHTFTDTQKIAIAQMAERQASNEQWD